MTQEPKMEGFIYKLISKHTDDIYIGATIQTLKNRLYYHIKNKDKSNITSKLILNKGDVDIILLETVLFTDIKELYDREKHYIQTSSNCVNKRNKFKTEKEVVSFWRENNREKLREGYKKYYNEHRKKERVILTIDEKKQNKQVYMNLHKKDKKEYDKQYRLMNKDKLNIKINCECGGFYQQRHKSSHLKTKIHNDYINIYRIDPLEKKIDSPPADGG